MFRTTAEWHLLFFAKFRSHRVKNKKVMTRTSSQLNAPVLMTEPFNLGKRLRNEHRNSIPMTRHYPDPDLGRAGSNGWKFASSNQKHYPDLGCDASSAWNFSARFSDVISRRNRWRLEMLAVSSRWTWVQSSGIQLQRNSPTVESK